MALIYSDNYSLSYSDKTYDSGYQSIPNIQFLELQFYSNVICTINIIWSEDGSTGSSTQSFSYIPNNTYTILFFDVIQPYIKLNLSNIANTLSPCSLYIELRSPN